MAGEVWFYHLERSSLDAVLPPLLEKSLERGWRALVRTPSPERVAHLDQALWSYSDEGFLPHGRADEEDAERQPVLLTTGTDNANGANLLVLIDQAPAGDIDGFARTVLMFDGRDERALTEARAEWKRLKAEGRELAYWQQGARGGWEKKA